MLRKRFAVDALPTIMQSSNYMTITTKKRGQYLTKCQAHFRTFLSGFGGSA